MRGHLTSTAVVPVPAGTAACAKTPNIRVGSALCRHIAARGQARLRSSIRSMFASCALAASAQSAAFAQAIDYKLYEALFQEPVTLSATGLPKRASEAPANITIITADDIARTGARDVADLIDRVAGVSVWRGGPGAAEVSIRGFNRGASNRLRVLLDGRQVYAEFFNLTTWSAIPVALDEIRQIEIVRGPAVALYGLNAVSGAINIVTKRVATEPTNSVNLRAGGEEYVEGAAVISHEIRPDLHVRVMAQAGHENPFERPATDDPLALNLRTDTEQLRTRARLHWTVSDTLSFELDGSFAAVELNEYIGSQDASATDIDMASLRLSATKVFGAWTLASQAFVNDGRNNAASTSFPLENLDFQHRTIVAQTDATRQIGETAALRLAGEYKRSETNTTPFDGGDLFFDLFAAGFSLDYGLTSKLSLTGAARVDHVRLGANGVLPAALPFSANDVDRTFTQPSANAALTYQWTQSDTVRLLYGRGALLPSLTELGALQEERPFVTPGFSVTLTVGGDPNNEPSTVDNFELRYDRLFASLGLKAAISGFYQITRGVVLGINGQQASPANNFNALFFTRDDARFDAFGGEFALNGEWRDWRYGVNYAYVDIDAENADYSGILPFDQFTSIFGNVGDVTVPQFDGFVSRHQVNAFVSTLWKCINARLDLSWSSERDVQSFEPSSTFRRIPAGDEVILGGRLGYKITDSLEASLQVNNALEDQWFETGAFANERRWFAALDYRW